MTGPAERKATLPTGRLLAAAWVLSMTVGVLWLVGALALGKGMTVALGGLFGTGVVAVAATVALMAIRPWRPKDLNTWPVVWTAGSFLRFAITLGGAFLLYSAPPFGTVTLWFAVVAAYVAVMVGETRVYALSMRRFAPGRVEASASESALE